MRAKHRISIRSESGETIGEIKRVLTAEAIGNFNPIFCTYKGDRCLVRSDKGDLSDPFRRDPSYLAELYIVESGRA